MVNLERFGRPGWTLLGSTAIPQRAAGSECLLLVPAGLDVAVAMGGGAYYLSMPKVCRC